MKRLKYLLLLGLALLSASPVRASIPRHSFTPHQTETDLPPKNRVVGFEDPTPILIGFFPVQGAESHRVVWLIPEKTASGIRYFLSSDPIGIQGGLNLYVYGSDNPLAFLDPLGLCDRPSWGQPGQSLGSEYTGQMIQREEFINRWQDKPLVGPAVHATVAFQNGQYGRAALYTADTAVQAYLTVAGVRGLVPAESTPSITFQTGHVTQHLKDLGLPAQKVEAAIASEIKGVTQGASQTGSFWGRVPVDGKIVEYRAFTLSDGTINVGTYYPPTP